MRQIHTHTRNNQENRIPVLQTTATKIIGKVFDTISLFVVCVCVWNECFKPWNYECETWNRFFFICLFFFPSYRLILNSLRYKNALQDTKCLFNVFFVFKRCVGKPWNNNIYCTASAEMFIFCLFVNASPHRHSLTFLYLMHLYPDSHSNKKSSSFTHCMNVSQGCVVPLSFESGHKTTTKT